MRINPLAYASRAIAFLFVTVVTVFGAVFFRLIVIPFVYFFTPDKARFPIRVRIVVTFLMRMLVWFLEKGGLMKLKVDGLKALRQSPGPFVVVANHPSALDSVILLSLIPNSICIAKAYLTKVPFLGGIISSAGFVVTDSQEHIITECQRALESGANVLFFPEGTRTTPDELVGTFKPGVGALILRSGVVTIPVSLSCSPRVLYKGQPWQSVPTTRFEFRVMLCDPPECSCLPVSLTEERSLRPKVVSRLQQIISERQDPEVSGER